MRARTRSVSLQANVHRSPIAQAAIQTAIRDQWLRIATPGDSSLLRLLLLQLHQGEAEATALASELNADITLMDEQEGRQLASRTGLAVTGVLGILLRAKRLGEIHAVKPEIDLLRSKARSNLTETRKRQPLPSPEPGLPPYSGSTFGTQRTDPHLLDIHFRIELPARARTGHVPDLAEHRPLAPCPVEFSQHRPSDPRVPVWVKPIE
jgi:predicted nucleic acid-binding protein